MAEYNDKSKITKAIPAEEDNIELVIKLPKEIYVASRMLNVKPDDVVKIPLEVITNGTPLPKGHGEIVDVDAVIEWLKDKDIIKMSYQENNAREDMLKSAPTIIQADKVERTNEEQVLNGFYEMMKGLWDNQDLKMPNSVSERPPADVVERSKIDKAIAQLEEEKEFAYADFEEYNDDVLSYDDTDICEIDAYYIGLTRAIEILKRNLGDEE